MAQDAGTSTSAFVVRGPWYRAVFAGVGPGLPACLRVMALSTLGNALGGAVFVALLRFAHARAGPPSSKPA